MRKTKPYIWITERYSREHGVVQLLQYEFRGPGTSMEEFKEAVREVAQSIPRTRPILIKARVMEYYQSAVETLKELDPPIIGVYNPTIGKYVIVYVGSSWQGVAYLGQTMEKTQFEH